MSYELTPCTLGIHKWKGWKDVKNSNNQATECAWCGKKKWNKNKIQNRVCRTRSDHIWGAWSSPVSKSKNNYFHETKEDGYMQLRHCEICNAQQQTTKTIPMS